jgi:hypothetical protein
MSETQWLHTLHISLNQGKSDGLQFGLQRLDFKFRMFQFLKPDVLVTKTKCSSFY